jgi:hypothetical protein
MPIGRGQLSQQRWDERRRLLIEPPAAGIIVMTIDGPAFAAGISQAK